METPGKSIIDQILDRMFTLLEEHEEFNEQTLHALQELRDNGTLSKQAHIQQALATDRQ
jgi:hypothetical protein